MLLQILWRTLLWMAAWRLLFIAGTTGNTILLAFDILYVYFMCVKWYPMFPYDQRSVDE